ncbi:unnamed protein product, partial [Staurois parvus]
MIPYCPGAPCVVSLSLCPSFQWSVPPWSGSADTFPDFHISYVG